MPDEMSIPPDWFEGRRVFGRGEGVDVGTRGDGAGVPGDGAGGGVVFGVGSGAGFGDGKTIYRVNCG